MHPHPNVQQIRRSLAVPKSLSARIGWRGNPIWPSVSDPPNNHQITITSTIGMLIWYKRVLSKHNLVNNLTLNCSESIQFLSCLFGSRYYIYSTLQHTAGGLYVEYKSFCKYIRVPSASKTRTAQLWYRVCPVSSIMQPRLKCECSQIAYSTAAVQELITALEDEHLHIIIAFIRFTKIQRSSRTFHHWFKRCLRIAETSWRLSLLGLESLFYELKNLRAGDAYPRRSPIRRL